MNPLPGLSEHLIEHYGERLAGIPVVAQDALTANFDNGLQIELRFASPEEYSIRWQVGDEVFGIDTAPLHRELATFPNHLHAAGGRLLADPLTQPGRAPWDNVQSVLEAVLASPRLEQHGAQSGN